MNLDRDPGAPAPAPEQRSPRISRRLELAKDTGGSIGCRPLQQPRRRARNARPHQPDRPIAAGRLSGYRRPMGRTVTDTAILLDALVATIHRIPTQLPLSLPITRGSYTQNLDPNGLKGARIGVLKEAFGSD